MSTGSIPRDDLRPAVGLDEPSLASADEFPGRRRPNAHRLLRSMPGALLLFDENNIVAEANPSAERMLRGSPLGLTMAELTLDDLPCFDEHDRREAVFYCVDGEPQPVLLSRRWFEAQTRQIWVAVELTEHRQLEAQLRHAQKLQSIGTLAAGLAHELNTPVYYIKDNLSFVEEVCSEVFGLLLFAKELLTAEATTAAREAFEQRADQIDLELFAEELPGALSSLRVGADRVTKIVGAMKAFSHPQPAKMSYFDINEGIRTVAIISSSEYKYVAELKLDLDELPRVKCRGDDLNTVFINLIVNAAHAIRDAGRRKGHIVVRTRDFDDRVEVAVSDDGPGIPEAVRDRIFEPFFTTKPCGQGTGQGLALVHSIVADHGGAVRLQSELGKGTTFTLLIPKNPHEGRAP